MLQAGFEKRSISPPKGVPLAGFAARQGVCEGVHDELFARALVIETASAAVALVSLDVLAVDSDFVAETRRAVAARVPIRPAAILISSTHTHAGPVTVSAFFNPDEPLDAGIMAGLRNAIVDAVESAWKQRFPAKISVGTGTSADLGVNRRSPDGKPVDREIGIVKVDDAQGLTRGILINYGCHPTVLGPDNLLASGDFPAMAIDRVESRIGEGSFAMFVNAAQGDISVGHSSELSAIGVITPGRTFERAAEIGHELGDAVVHAVPSIATHEGVSVGFKTLTVGLPLKKYPSPEQTGRSFREAGRHLATLSVNGDSPQRTQAKSELLYSSITHFYARQAANYADGVLPVELQAIQIGDSVFIAVPAEVFAEVGMRIKKSGGIRTFIAAVTNGYIGYLPTRKAFEAGGYEVVSSQCGPGAEDRLVEGVACLMETMAGPQ